jgi:hypothetical protein
MTDSMGVFAEHELLLKEHRSKKIREAVLEAQKLVESAKERSTRVSWFRALEGLLLKYHKRLPQSVVYLGHSGLENPLLCVSALSLDPSRTKYWVRGSFVYHRLRSYDQNKSTGAHVVSGAVVDHADLPDLLEVLEAARKEDLSSRVFIPDGTVLFEWENEVYKYQNRERVGTEWSARFERLELFASNLDSAISQFRLYRKKLHGVIAVRNVSVYLPGHSNKVVPEIDEMRVPTELSQGA